MGKKELKTMFGVFYEDNKFNSKLKQSYSFILYIRRIIYVSLGMFINEQNKSTFQVISILYLNLMCSVYLSLAKSQKTKELNWLETFNELMIMAVSSCMILFTNFVPSGEL